MTRRKVKLAFIDSDSERKISYRKRKTSLLKKTEELSTLCGIQACAIVFGPYDPMPEIWPSESGVQNVLEKFWSIPEWEQSKKMANQESFIAESIQKGKEKLKKLVEDNNKKEITMFMYQRLNKMSVDQPDKNMTAADLNVLSSVIEQNLRDIDRRLESLNANEITSHQTQAQMQTPVLPAAAEVMNAEPMQRQWFMDLLNGNVDATIMPPFGDVNLPF
ncbi:hypothetical protein VNO78_27991 [Psophocarpus tetragonolobus]|uniref:MADS-box domain-containing protein n=1 Tax=Psophocarpus tetragonolobus TaxID=3891 RepID=A0AAN9S179_PSOTE